MEISGILSSAITGPQSNAQTASEEFGFFDLLDIVNPFQHIPLVNNIYRSVTGDQIGGFANVVGSTIYGGPIGGGIALANEVVKADTGKDIVGNIFGDDEPTNTALVEKAAGKYEETAKKTAESSNSRRSTTHDWIYGGTHLA